ncbi:hypothetical protein AGMMS49938_09500 [Fibrobacterales bacterium]|nr:hypothetical protein AGMMS49938_09500 [Fibrobacterales bacterium]
MSLGNLYQPLMRLIVVTLSLFAIFANAQTYNVSKPYTLRGLEYSPLLYHYHDITAGNANASFFYPQMDSSFRSTANDDALLNYRSANNSAFLALSPIIAFDLRGGNALGDTIKSYEGGLFLRGYKDSIEFWLDARIFSEGHSADNPKSWDREFLENQGNKGIEGETKYSSYARYRGHFTIRLGWAVLDFARDAAHWGPGYYNNLSLNQNSVPFNQITLTTKIGPLSVISLYGDLRVSENSMSTANVASRNVYGHRYELELGNTTIGINELTVLYDLNKPFLFIPIVPLFMEKGQYSEDRNNGTLSLDLNVNLPLGFRTYGEFLLDDMESPTSLIRNDNIEAKWAFMAGAAWAGDFETSAGKFKVGTLAEYARIEPYTFSHFHPYTAQVAHLGYPLGSQAGANSQTVDWVVYARRNTPFQMQVKQQWAWKGSDYGSAINDTTPTRDHFKTEKNFLCAETDENNNCLRRAKMKYALTPAISYQSTHYAISTEYSFFSQNAFCARFMMMW